MTRSSRLSLRYRAERYDLVTLVVALEGTITGYWRLMHEARRERDKLARQIVADGIEPSGYLAKYHPEKHPRLFDWSFQSDTAANARRRLLEALGTRAEAVGHEAWWEHAEVRDRKLQELLGKDYHRAE